MAECYVLTLQNCIANFQDELSFEEGVVLKIVQKRNDGWWLAVDEKRSMQGLILMSYVREIQNVDTKVKVAEKNTDTYTHPDIVLLHKATNEDRYGNPDEVLMFESKQGTENSNNLGENVSNPDEIDPEYAYPAFPDEAFLKEVKNRNENSFVYGAGKTNNKKHQDFKGTYSFDEEKSMSL